MEWFTNIGTYLSGQPWYSAAVIIILSIACTKGVDALLKLRRSRLEERQYEDGQTREGYEALIAQLKEQVKELKSDMAGVLSELKDVRAAHVKCEIEQAELRGEFNVMKEKVDRLTAHDQANQEHKKAMKEAVKKIDPTAAAELP